MQNELFEIPGYAKFSAKDFKSPLVLFQQINSNEHLFESLLRLDTKRSCSFRVISEIKVTTWNE